MSEKYVTLNLLSNGTESESVQVDDESGFLEIQTPPKGRGVLLVVLIPGPGTVESSPQLHMLVNNVHALPIVELLFVQENMQVHILLHIQTWMHCIFYEPL